MKISIKRIKTFIVFSIAIWLHLLNVLFIYYGGLSNIQLELLILMSLPILAILFTLKNNIVSIDNTIIIPMLILTCLYLLGFMTNSSLGTLGRSLNFLYLNVFCVLYIVKIDNGIEKLFRNYALLGLPVLIIIYMLIVQSGSRHDLAVQPNFIGMIVLSIVLSSIYLNSKVFLFLIYIFSFAILAITSSRASLLSVMLILFLELFYFREIAYFGIKKFILKIFFLFVYFSVGISYGYVFLQDMFLLNDSYRGLDSGFSGREDRWITAFNKWFENFWFGVGYGESISYMNFSIDNAYLTILIETGLIGLLFYTFIMVSSIYRVIKTRQYFLLLFLSIYLFYGIFEKRYFSVGNSFSILLLFVLYHVHSTSKRKELG